MASTNSLRTFVLAVVALGLALFVAFVAAGRGNAEFGDIRNDTLGYQEHYVCLAKGNDFQDCNSLISTNFTEYIYPLFVASIAKIAGPENFYFFKLFFALTIGFAILFSCGLLSQVPSLTFMILILDFRFWEYVANSLRNGAAVAVFMSIFAFYMLRARRMPFWAKLISGFTHSGTLVLALAPSRKLGIKTIILIVAGCVSILATASLWLPLLSGGALSTDKLAYYSQLAGEDATGFAMPLHYVLIMVAMAYLYIRSEDKVFISLFNILGVLLIFAAILGTINLAYRAVSLMLPFVAVGVTYPIAGLVPQARTEYACGTVPAEANYSAGFQYCAAYIAVLGFFVLALARNFDAVRIHLS